MEVVFHLNPVVFLRLQLVKGRFETSACLNYSGTILLRTRLDVRISLH